MAPPGRSEALGIEPRVSEGPPSLVLERQFVAEGTDWKRGADNSSTTEAVTSQGFFV